MPDIVLVHGTAGDHTVWRAVDARLASRGRIHAIDRRGRGQSGDGPPPYALESEFGDLARVVDAVAASSGGPVDVVGHSLGGRIALGAALRTDNVRRLVVYEGAPAPPDHEYRDDAAVAELQQLLATGDLDAVYARFLGRVVGMPAEEIERYRSGPTWLRRIAAAPTVVRELAVEADDSASTAALEHVDIPVLQILGGDSLPIFADAVRWLDTRLPDGRLVVIPGARHAAHHTHVAPFLAAVIAFLDEA